MTDYKFGNSRSLYSTAPDLFAGRIGKRDILFLNGDTTQQHEAAIVFSGSSGKLSSNPLIRLRNPAGKATSETIISVRSGLRGHVTIWDSYTQLILFGDTDSASAFFAPGIPSSSSSGDEATFQNYWQFGSNKTVLVGGPYLVRNATISGSTLAIRGDLNGSITLTVIAPPEFSRVTWNGIPVLVDIRASRSLTSVVGFVGQLKMLVSSGSVDVPKLQNWKFANSLPEVQSNFSDEAWTTANRTATNIPFPMHYGDGRILYACDHEL